MTDCYDRASSTGAYALGALPAEEAAEFEAALAESPELRAETDSLAATAALLAEAVPEVEPSPGLKASILAAIDAEPASTTASEPAAAPAAPDAGAPATTARDAGLAEGEHVARRRSRTRALRTLIPAAAAVVLFVAGALAGGLITAVSAARTADRFAALNAAPDVVRTETALPDGGSIEFVASEELGMSAVVLHQAELPDDRTFQAWYVVDSEPESAGVVEPDADATVYRMLEGNWDGGAVAMTIEPEGGSPQPTTEPMVLTEAPTVS